MTLAIPITTIEPNDVAVGSRRTSAAISVAGKTMICAMIPARMLVSR